MDVRKIRVNAYKKIDPEKFDQMVLPMIASLQDPAKGIWEDAYKCLLTSSDWGPLEQLLMWKTFPISVMDFVTDEDYMNLAEQIRPKILEGLEELFHSPDHNYHEVVLSGSLGWGKSFFADMALAYQVYLLSRMWNPARAFDLARESKIVLPIQSITERKAKDAVFHHFKKLIQTSRYFRAYFRPEPKIESELRFPNGVWVTPVAGNDMAVISENVFGGYIDECSRGDTEVLTTEGYVKISEMVGENKIISLDISSGCVYSTVATVKPSGIAPIYAVGLDDGRELGTTWNHPYLVRMGGGFRWVHAADLRVGDELVVVDAGPERSSSQGVVARADVAGQEGVMDAGAPGRSGGTSASSSPHFQTRGSEPVLRPHAHGGDSGQDAPRVGDEGAGVGGDAGEDERGPSREEGTLRGVQALPVGPQQYEDVQPYSGEQSTNLGLIGGNLVGWDDVANHEAGNNQRWFPIASISVGGQDGRGSGSRSERDGVQVRSRARPIPVERPLARDHRRLPSDYPQRDPSARGEEFGGVEQGQGAGQDCRSKAVRGRPWMDVRGLDRTTSVSRVVSIRIDPPEQTYDLSAPHFQNFIANGIVVHNTNFMPVVENSKRMYSGDANPNVYDQAVENYNAFRSRMRNRFLTEDGSLPGKLIMSSSARHPDDFTERKEEEALREFQETGKRTILVLRYAIWETVTKWDAAPKFHVMTGDMTHRPRILEEGERPAEIFGKVIPVPTPLRPDFDRDIFRAMREVAGISTFSIEPFILRRDVLHTAVMAGEARKLSHPFTMEAGTIREVRLVVEKLIKHGFWCALHIDLARSKDFIGIAVGHVEGTKNVWREEPDQPARVVMVPYIVMDLMLRIHHPRQDETVFADIRGLIFDFLNAGLKIRFATVDSYQCVAGDSMVWTARGTVPARDVTEGDVVQSRVGPRRVVHRWAFGRRPVVRIVTRDGHEISATAGHRFEAAVGWWWPSVNGVQVKTPRWDWKAVEDLCVGDVVRTWDRRAEVGSGEYVSLKPCVHGVNSRRDVILPGFLTPAVAEWLGIFHGDGNADGDSVHISCHLDEIDDAAEITEKVIGRSPSVRKSGNRGRVSVSSRGLLRWLRDNELGKDHAVPEALRASPTEVQAAFLRGLFSTDGNVSKRGGKCSLSSSKIEVLRYAQDFLRMAYGIQTRITKIRRVPGESYPTAKEFQYVLGVRGGRRLFAETVGFCYAGKRRVLESHSGVKGRSFLTKIAEIHHGEADVYDFEVEGDPSYVVNGFVSHNSTDTRQLLRQQGFKTGEVSTDKMPRGAVVYNDLKMALYEERLAIYPYAPFLKETAQLEVNSKTGKVDHPVHGSKDVADAVASVVHVLTRRRDAWYGAGGRPNPTRKNIERRRGSAADRLRIVRNVD